MYRTEVLVHYFQELESVYLLCMYCRPKFIAHPVPQFWQKKIILPFLTAAKRKHVQIHVTKTCRQASVANSLVTLNFLNFTNIPTQPWMENRFYALVWNLDCTQITITLLMSNVRHLVIWQRGGCSCPLRKQSMPFSRHLDNFSTINKFLSTKLKKKEIMYLTTQYRTRNLCFLYHYTTTLIRQISSNLIIKRDFPKY